MFSHSTLSYYIRNRDVSRVSCLSELFIIATAYDLMGYKHKVPDYRRKLARFREACKTNLGLIGERSLKEDLHVLYRKIKICAMPQHASLPREE